MTDGTQDWRREMTTWTAEELQIDADGPVPAGIDGEAVVLEPPLRFRIRAAALRCRVALCDDGSGVQTAVTTW